MSRPRFGFSASTVYLNGRRYVREVTNRTDLNGRYAVLTTFAYNGVPDGWPTVITYTIREH